MELSAAQQERYARHLILEEFGGEGQERLLAADEELPDLPRDSALPEGIERIRVTRAEASQAWARVARELGLLASHASAAAAVYAHEHGGVALITAPGEREFSLERAT